MGRYQMDDELKEQIRWDIIKALALEKEKEQQRKRRISMRGED